MKGGGFAFVLAAFEVMVELVGVLSAFGVPGAAQFKMGCYYAFLKVVIVILFYFADFLIF